jgi:hypothetical protein
MPQHGETFLPAARHKTPQFFATDFGLKTRLAKLKFTKNRIFKIYPLNSPLILPFILNPDFVNVGETLAEVYFSVKSS